MRLKTFTATSMNEALELIRKEMGPNAVIVSSADDKEGVEVTAALESGDLDFAAFEKSDDQMASTLNLINTLCTLADQQRLPERIRDHWFEAFSAQELDHPNALERSLEEMILFNPDQLFNPSSYEPLVFVGPPGCGKTVTLAKLAAYYLIQDRKIKIVTTDILKAGSLNQFKTYFDAMDQTFITADNRDTLRQIFTSLNKDEYLFVDTPGINPYNKSELYQLKDLLSGIPSFVSLVLPAGLDALEAIEIADRFIQVRACSIIASRCDAASNYSGILSAAYEGQLSINAYSDSPEIAHLLHPMKAETLIGMLKRCER